MRTIEVGIPLLPVVAPAADAAPEPTSTFGPLGWEWASQGNDGDEAAKFQPILELLHIRAFNIAVATCPGAVSWRLDPGSAFVLYSLNGAAIVISGLTLATESLYAIDASGAELGPITIVSVA